MMSDKIPDRRERASKTFLVLAVLVLSWLQLQLSCVCHSLTELIRIDIRYVPLNIAAEGILLILLLLVFGSLRRSCAVYSGVSLLLAAANRCTILWHDSPLTWADLSSWRTAANVLSGYHLSLYTMLDLILISAAEGFLVYRIKRPPREFKMTWKRRTAAALLWCFAAFLAAFFGYASPWPLMPKTDGFSWVSDYQKYGYVNCTVSAAQQAHSAAEMLVKPDRYDSLNIDSIQIEEDMPIGHTHETPDIILILNETFYDLSLLTELETDVPYMKQIQTLDNAVRGYAVNPAGGTNPSEYELLTGNSMKPMHGIYPFVTLDMNGANSIVSHLEALGYSTAAAHCAQPENYNRGRAYPDMGFDRVYFDGDFTDLEYYGDRILATDASAYQNLLSWYRDSDPAVPQFFYLLTIQNHGGWQRNGSELDIVHAQGDFGEYSDQIDEYLSCIYLSDQAFRELTGELEKTGRKVIVCMVGDHGPSFTGQLIDNPTSPESLRLRTSVPFVIWANYPLLDALHLDGAVMSMNDLVPALLKTAGVALSPYYQQMLALREDVPILTAYAGYYDRYDVMHDYDGVGKYQEAVDFYRCLEYNNLQPDRNQQLFAPYHSGTG